MTETELQSAEIKITVPWGHVAARTYGLSTGKPVLMVHGRLDNAETFTRLIKYLPMDCYYVCIDLPGHGLSSHFPSWLSLDFLEYIYAIHHILEVLQWKTCIYVGHSMGASLGIIYSILQPHRIKKIIALDGFIPVVPIKGGFIANLNDMFEVTIKNHDDASESQLYTKEEVLYALQYKRYSVLNIDAANALFRRAVTEVNGKYKYNRDKRLKRMIFSLASSDQLVEIMHNISVPIYLFLPADGTQKQYKEQNLNKKLLEIDSIKFPLQIIHTDGNHDFHNNNPEKIAPFICKLLNSNISSKL